MFALVAYRLSTSQGQRAPNGKYAAQALGGRGCVEDTRGRRAGY